MTTLEAIALIALALLIPFVVAPLWERVIRIFEGRDEDE